MKGLWIGTVLLSLSLVAPLFTGSAAAKDVSSSLIAQGLRFHFGSLTGPDEITVDPGDVLRLTITNPSDGVLHTFTFPHFSIDVNVPDGATVFVNITTAAADAGRWQFHCTPHSSPAGTEFTGMVGYVTVTGSSPPPRSPGFEVAAAIGALVVAFVAVLAVRRWKH